MAASSGTPPRDAGRGLVLMMTGAMYVFLASSYVSIAVNSLSLGLMALCWAMLMIVQRRWLVRPTPFDYLFLGYAVAEIVATVFSVNPGQSLMFAKRILLIGIVYFLSSRVTTVEGAQRAVGVLLGSASLVGLWGVVKLALGAPGENTRLGIFQFYMTTAELMMIAFLLTLPFLIHRNTPSTVRLLAAGALIPVTISLYATVTRGAYLAAAAGVVMIALLRSRKLLLPLAAFIILMIAFAPPYVVSRMESIVDLHHPENSSRLILWKTGLKIFSAHPVVGVGDIDLGDLLRQYAEPGYTGEWGHLHNTGLQILVTLGALGAAAVLAMFVWIVRTEWRIYRAVEEDWFKGSVALGALAVFVGFQVNGLTEWSLGDQEVAILFWVSVGLSLVVGNLRGAGPPGKDGSWHA